MTALADSFAKRAKLGSNKPPVVVAVIGTNETMISQLQKVFEKVATSEGAKRLDVAGECWKTDSADFHLLIPIKIVSFDSYLRDVIEPCSQPSSNRRVSREQTKKKAAKRTELTCEH